MDDMPVYHVGTIEGGGRVLSHESVTPQEGVEVWLEADPENKMSFDAMEAAHDVTWEMEPTPADGTPRQAAATPDELAEMGGYNKPNSPMQLLDEAEERIGTIEGMVADVILADVQDEVFLGEPEDEDEPTDDEPDEEIVGEDVDEEEDQPKDAKRASAVAAAKDGSLVQGLAGMLQRAVVAAAIAADEAAGSNPSEDVPEGDGEVASEDGDASQAAEVAARIESLMDRIQKLEESIAGLLDSQMEDTELVDLPDDTEDSIVEGESDDDEDADKAE